MAVGGRVIPPGKGWEMVPQCGDVRVRRVFAWLPVWEYSEDGRYRRRHWFRSVHRAERFTKTKSGYAWVLAGFTS